MTSSLELEIPIQSSRVSNPSFRSSLQQDASIPIAPSFPLLPDRPQRLRLWDADEFCVLNIVLQYCIDVLLFQALIQFVANALASIRSMQAPMGITRATDYRDRSLALEEQLQQVSKLGQMKLFVKIDKCS